MSFTVTLPPKTHVSPQKALSPVPRFLFTLFLFSQLVIVAIASPTRDYPGSNPSSISGKLLHNKGLLNLFSRDGPATTQPACPTLTILGALIGGFCLGGSLTGVIWYVMDSQKKKKNLKDQLSHYQTELNTVKTDVASLSGQDDTNSGAYGRHGGAGEGGQDATKSGGYDRYAATTENHSQQ